MKIIIDIPEEMFEFAKKDMINGSATLANAIKNGKPLPKGHGRLIDADAILINDTRLIEKHDKKRVTVVFADDIDAAPTIIEADKEGET